MIISATEIANAAAAYRTWEPSVIPFPSRRGRILKPHTISWARSAYEALPSQRDTLVLDLRGRIVAGRYFVPARLIVDKLLGRLFIDRIAS
ncbi:MAG: flagellar biosynthesis anti-sigma factor FlgM [Candidatus Eremiobacteraeota bacterium]|nr:flagellar biosynthesis anti-sigma factor FlgM [Candidatus Eremiobacteraeota bacterium]